MNADLIERTCAAVARLDHAAMAAARSRLDSLTKPPGSLGRLEDVVIHLAGIQGRTCPEVRPGTVVVAAADHGVTTEAISAYPREVTAEMVRNFLAGGAAINALARASGLRVRVVDIGVASDIQAPGLELRKVMAGTANLARGPAMTRAQALQAVAVGIELAADEAAAGSRLLVPGEMGIGNTTAASALLSALTGLPAAESVGRGTGLDAAGLERKRQVVEAALAQNRPDPDDPWDVLAKVGGLEIACLCGLILGAAAHRIAVLLDGFISGAAALVAVHAEPRVGRYLIAAHRSAEAGHAAMLRHLGLRPLLELGLRLGEGSGAAAAAPLLSAACAFMAEMATFAEAGISGGDAQPLPARAESAAPAAAEASALALAFAPAERQGVYRAITERRDMRSFRPEPLPDALLLRLLRAAHLAPSVGFMQPWRFILVREHAAKAALKALVERERQAQALYFQGQRAALFPKLKVDGILEAPVVICVAVDPTRAGPHVLGRHSDAATDVYSAACAIQNLWLAARAEGVGVGWVTFYRKPDVRQVLNIPAHVDPIALLCVGYVDGFPPRPILEEVGWASRLPLAQVVCEESWTGAPPAWAGERSPVPGASGLGQAPSAAGEPPAEG